MTVDLLAVAKLAQDQPGLFDGSGDPAWIEPGLLDAARAFSPGAPVHTGTTATKDQARCAAAFAMLSCGMSRREIGRRLGMSRHTLKAIEQEFEQGGKLAPLKDRVRRELALLLAEATEEARETIDRGARGLEASAWLKALVTAVGITFDKHQLATGGPTEISAQVGPDPRGLVDAWLARAAGAAVDAEVVTDPASAAGPMQGNDLDSCATVPATVPPASGTADPAGPGAVPAGAAGPEAGAAAGGGGSPSTPPAAHGDSSDGLQKLLPIAPP